LPAVLIGLLFLTTPVIPRGSVRLARLLDLGGVLVAIAGQALRIAVIGYRYIVRGGSQGRVFARELVTSGIFGLSRNPLYLGNLLVILGLLVIWNSPWMYAIGVPFLLFSYRAIVAAEEAYLGRQFGAAYAAYARQTPRWWPRWGGLAAATAGLRFNWRRVVLKEYSSTAEWTIAAAMLLMFKARFYAAFEGTEARTWPYWIAVTAAAALWGWVRYLKKSKRLREQPASAPAST
jgi:protein-S-isoprenylcysteine O-methyltransferase Ste14